MSDNYRSLRWWKGSKQINLDLTLNFQIEIEAEVDMDMIQLGADLMCRSSITPNQASYKAGDIVNISFTIEHGASSTDNATDLEVSLRFIVNVFVNTPSLHQPLQLIHALLEIKFCI